MPVSDWPVIASIHTDGACSGNPGPGGWGVVIDFVDGSRHELGGACHHTTNNQMELQAAISALKWVKQQLNSPSAFSLYTDSEYVLKGITQWIMGWKKKGWKTAKGKAVLNQDLWQTLDTLNAPWVDWRYVPGHAGYEGNERCDHIARTFALGKIPTLHQLDASMTDFNDSHAPASEVDSTLNCARVGNLRDLIETLHIANEIATQGFLITSSELADLMDVNASAVTSRGDEWVWRNWLVSRVRREGNQILWQLERVN
ncbi:ribonuclease HI [Synechococcales cyanobacterium C]|uniref:Ribonuclease H n=1 Tax=Petrachloros mirabilis ULC683 TaxID=2781853 RepID=A0A8K2A2K6_9CYAN|nr:ribonuclease HI [Petrachloros mirabilis]NCJ08663.1 ribonuclease HI [Petrachloros mirabilis ULC683]